MLDYIHRRAKMNEILSMIFGSNMLNFLMECQNQMKRQKVTYNNG
jgi:hypothetical protein